MDFDSRLDMVRKRINKFKARSEESIQHQAPRNKEMKNSEKRRHKARVRRPTIWGLRRREEIYEGERMFEEIMAKYFSEPAKSINLHIYETNPSQLGQIIKNTHLESSQSNFTIPPKR